MLKDLRLFQTIIAECKYGQPIDGVQNGGKYIANALKLDVVDTIEEKYFNGVNNNYDNGYYKLSRSIINNHTNGKTLLLGGDHSVGISSIDAMLHTYGDDLRILWIDAHADINDYNNSVSGNIHGMPLGFHFIGTDNIVPWRNNQNRLKPYQLCYYGIRDLDLFEKNLIDKYNVNYNNIEDIKLFMKSAPNLMISFDVDSIDPSYIDATGTKVNDGITCENVNDIMNYAINECNLVHLDITELNPMIGDIDKSINSLHKCFA